VALRPRGRSQRARSSSRRCGWSDFSTPGDANELEVSGFRQGLKETGLVEGHNVAIEYRWTDGQFDRFPALAIELVRRPVDVIFAFWLASPRGS
jgi:putative ABC transport system substrate-binding protein